jgi:hypothetical protein
VSHEWKMPVQDCLERHSRRQLLVLCAWLDQQWNRPSRTDNYLMQIACEIVRGRVRNPGAVHVGNFRLQFGEAGPTKPVTKEEATIASKAKWLGALLSPQQAAEIMERERKEGKAKNGG